MAICRQEPSWTERPSEKVGGGLVPRLLAGSSQLHPTHPLPWMRGQRAQRSKGNKIGAFGQRAFQIKIPGLSWAIKIILPEKGGGGSGLAQGLLASRIWAGLLGAGRAGRSPLPPPLPMRGGRGIWGPTLHHLISFFNLLIEDTEGIHEFGEPVGDLTGGRVHCRCCGENDQLISVVKNHKGPS